MMILITILCISYIASKQPQCAKFECGPQDNNTCVYEKSGIDTVGYNNVTIYDVCQEGQKCEVDRYDYQSLSYFNNDRSYKCIPVPTIRYPGEDCNNDSDCYSVGEPHKCTEGKCSGIALGDSCIVSEDCLIGLSCQDSKCMPQKKFGESCYYTDDCVNSLLCFNSTCSVTPYSLPLGSYFETQDVDIAGNYCVLGQFASVHEKYFNFFCVSNNQTWSEDYQKCNNGDTCTYEVTIIGNLTIDCSCGFNPDQQGYCPQGLNLSNILVNFRGTGVA
jgi:hypothetical protein